jgi:pyruvate formate lyase activating enzyme
VERSLASIDFLITDIKHMDPEKHRQYTGGNLNVVLENIKRLCQAGKQTIIRIPLIPHHNDDAENIRRTGRFLAETCGPNLQQVQVLQFHELGKSKYAALGQDYPLADLEKPSREDYIASVRRSVAILQEYGLPAHADSKLVMTR